MQIPLGAGIHGQVLAGSLVQHAGYRIGFLALSAIACWAFVILWLFMPETLRSRSAPAMEV